MRLRKDLTAEEVSGGFTADSDIFSRRDLASRLTGLFEHLEGGSVCILDGRWGSGKSTFVKQWAAELRKAGRPAVYFDAFAADYIESPFEAIAAAFISEAARAGKTDDVKYRNFLKSAAAVGRMVSVVAAKVGVKAATLGVIGNSEFEALDGLKDIVVEGTAELTEKAVEQMLESHAESVAKFEKLKKALADLPYLLRENSEENNNSLIIFIDELDRCRPDFSLGILETLKHFFRAENLHFVLVTNRNYLELSVAHRYGSGLAAGEYLEKFFDFSVQFDVPYERNNTSHTIKYIRSVTSRIVPEDIENIEYIRENIEAICVNFKLSLREIETFIINVGIALIAARQGEFRHPMLITHLCLFKSKRPDLFSQAKTGKINLSELLAYLDQYPGGQDGMRERIKKVFRYYVDPNLDVNSPDYEGWGADSWRYNLDRERVIPYLANSIVERFGVPSNIFNSD